MRADFLSELESQIEKTRNLELLYFVTELSLTLVIAACGFLTAASTNVLTKELWVGNPNAILTFGLLSALSAIVNQVLKPSEKYLFHKKVKKSLRNILGAVKYSEMPVPLAERLKALALLDPFSVTPQIQNYGETNKKA